MSLDPRASEAPDVNAGTPLPSAATIERELDAGRSKGHLDTVFEVQDGSDDQRQVRVGRTNVHQQLTHAHGKQNEHGVKPQNAPPVAVRGLLIEPCVRNGELTGLRPHNNSNISHICRIQHALP